MSLDRDDMSEELKDQLREDAKVEREEKFEAETANQLVHQCLGYMIFFQSNNIEVPKFPAHFNGWVICNLSGRNDQIIKWCKEYLDSFDPLIVDVEKKKKESEEKKE